jgi:hypothetical protein
MGFCSTLLNLPEEIHELHNFDFFSLIRELHKIKMIAIAKRAIFRALNKQGPKNSLKSRNLNSLKRIEYHLVLIKQKADFKIC